MIRCEFVVGGWCCYLVCCICIISIIVMYLGRLDHSRLRAVGLKTSSLLSPYFQLTNIMMMLLLVVMLLFVIGFSRSYQRFVGSLLLIDWLLLLLVGCYCCLRFGGLGWLLLLF